MIEVFDHLKKAKQLKDFMIRENGTPIKEKLFEDYKQHQSQ